jgi:hypothetical protein
MKSIARIGSGCLLAALSFVAGAWWGREKGFERGAFLAALEGNKVAASNLTSSEPSLCPEFRAYLKGRI